MTPTGSDLEILINHSRKDFIVIFEHFSELLKAKPINFNNKKSFKALLAHIKVSSISTKNRIWTILNHPDPISLKQTDLSSSVQTLESYYQEISKDREVRTQRIWVQAQTYLANLMVSVCQKVPLEINPYTGEIWRPGSKELVKKTFISYYWNESENRTKRTVKTGLVTLTFISEGIRDTDFLKFQLELFPGQKDSKLSTNLTSIGIKQIDRILYVQVTDEETHFLKTDLTLFVGTESPETWKIITGTFTTVRRGNNNLPIAGKVLLQENTDGLSPEQIAVHAIDPEIYSYLYRSRLYGTEHVYKDISALPSAGEVSLLNSYTGFYHCTYYRKAKTITDEKLGRVEKFLFEVKPNGETEMTVPGVNKPYLGRTRVLGSRNFAVISYLDFMPAENTYRFTIYFNKEFTGKNDTLHAVYAGLERKEPDVPTAGRMILRKILPPSVDERKLLVHAIDYENILRWSREKPENEEDFNILSGRSNKYDYFESLAPLLFPKKLPTQFFPYHGTFYVYALSTKQDEIYRVPLKISTEGLVEMKVREVGSNSIHRGVATLGVDRIALTMEQVDSPNENFHFLFSRANTAVDKLEHLFGVSSTMDNHGYPSGRIEVLVKGDYDFAEVRTKTFKIDSKDYWIEDKRTGKLLRYLTGKSNRIIVSKKDSNKEFVRKTEKSYFYASCYLCANNDLKEDPAHVEESLRLLYQAYLHGFGWEKEDIKLLKKEMAGAFVKAQKFKLKTKPDTSDLEKLSFKQLFARILKRQTNRY